jgi:hypothetical protein
MDRRRLEDAFFLFAGLEVVHKWNIDIGSVLFDDAFLQNVSEQYYEHFEATWAGVFGKLFYFNLGL